MKSTPTQTTRSRSRQEATKLKQPARDRQEEPELKQPAHDRQEEPELKQPARDRQEEPELKQPARDRQEEPELIQPALVQREEPELEHDSCCNVVHQDVVAAAQASRAALPDATVQRMANFYQALGDPTRLRIVHALIASEMCVCDIAAVLEMTQSSISHQLRHLKNLGLIKRRKAGRMVYYSIDDGHVLTLFETGLAHVTHRDREGH